MFFNKKKIERLEARIEALEDFTQKLEVHMLRNPEIYRDWSRALEKESQELGKRIARLEGLEGIVESPPVISKRFYRQRVDETGALWEESDDEDGPFTACSELTPKRRENQ